MTVFVPGHSTIVGSPETIVKLLKTVLKTPQGDTAETILEKMAQDGSIIIKHRRKRDDFTSANTR